MRTRVIFPAALAAAALVLVPALPAAAATTTWISPTDSWWSTATWSTTAPVAGDDVVFAGGVRSTYNFPGTTTFSTFSFTNEHRIANGGGAIALSNGLAVADLAPVVIEPGLSTTASQTWSVGAGGSLTLPSVVNVVAGSALTLDVDGTLAVTTGNLDGAASACILKSGTGVLSISSGGGGVGTCATYPLGLVTTDGETTITPGTSIGGKDFVAAGGLFTGGSVASPAIVRQLSLVGAGTVSPGGSAGTGLGHLNLWGTSAWTDGTYVADLDAGGTSDRVTGDNQAISVTGTVLSPRLIGTPVAGQSWRVLASDIAVTAAFESPAGVVLADGDEFEANGQIFEIAYDALGVDVAWLRAAPVIPVVPPVTPAATLPNAGPADAAPAALVALLAIFAGLGLLAASRRIATP